MYSNPPNAKSSSGIITVRQRLIFSSPFPSSIISLSHPDCSQLYLSTNGLLSWFSHSSNNTISLFWWWTLRSIVDRIPSSLWHVARLWLLQLNIVCPCSILLLRIHILSVMSIISLVRVKCCTGSLVSLIWRWRRVVIASVRVVVCLLMTRRRFAVGNPACSVHGSSSATTTTAVINAPA